MSRLRLTLSSLLVTFASMARAQNLPAEGPEDPLVLIAAAEKRIKERMDEDLVLDLWRAEQLLLDKPASVARDAALDTVRGLLAKADPNENARREALAAVAKLQVELAQAYRTKKWLEAAEERLQVALRLDAAVCAKEQGLLAAARQGKAAPPQPAPAAAGPKPLLDASNFLYQVGDWKLEGGVLESPPIKDKSYNTLWLSKLKHADHEISCEMNIGTAEGLAALLIGGKEKSTANSYVITLNQWSNQITIGVTQVTEVATDVTTGDVPLSPTRDGYRRLSVQVRGDRIKVSVDGNKAVECRCPTEIRGWVGLTVSPMGPGSGVVKFRNLRIDPLPEQQDDAAERKKMLEEQRKGLLEDVGRAEAMLKQKQPEAAALALRAAQGRLRQVEAGTLRDNVGASIEKLLVQADALHGKRKKAGADSAAVLVAVADAYVKNGWPRAALEVCLESAKFDDGQARVKAAQEAVAQWNVAQAQARAAELGPPADDGALLRQWFAGGRTLDKSQAWVVEGAAARVEAMEPEHFTMQMPQKDMGRPAKVAVSMRLPVVDTYGGLCFEVAGLDDFSVCLLHRSAKGLELAIHRRTQGRWRMLGRKSIAVPSWRQEGWFELVLQTSPGGVLAQAMGASVQIERRDLGRPDGRIGLCAGNSSKEKATVELRAFRLPE